MKEIDVNTTNRYLHISYYLVLCLRIQIKVATGATVATKHKSFMRERIGLQCTFVDGVSVSACY